MTALEKTAYNTDSQEKGACHAMKVGGGVELHGITKVGQEARGKGTVSKSLYSGFFRK